MLAYIRDSILSFLWSAFVYLAVFFSIYLLLLLVVGNLNNEVAKENAVTKSSQSTSPAFDYRKKASELMSSGASPPSPSPQPQENLDQTGSSPTRQGGNAFDSFIPFARNSRGSPSPESSPKLASHQTSNQSKSSGKKRAKQPPSLRRSTSDEGRVRKDTNGRKRTTNRCHASRYLRDVSPSVLLLQLMPGAFPMTPLRPSCGFQFSPAGSLAALSTSGSSASGVFNTAAEGTPISFAPSPTNLAMSINENGLGRIPRPDFHRPDIGRSPSKVFIDLTNTDDGNAVQFNSSAASGARTDPIEIRDSSPSSPVDPTHTDVNPVRSKKRDLKPDERRPRRPDEKDKDKILHDWGVRIHGLDDDIVVKGGPDGDINIKENMREIRKDLFEARRRSGPWDTTPFLYARDKFLQQLKRVTYIHRGSGSRKSSGESSRTDPQSPENIGLSRSSRTREMANELAGLPFATDKNWQEKIWQALFLCRNCGLLNRIITGKSARDRRQQLRGALTDEEEILAMIENKDMSTKNLPIPSDPDSPRLRKTDRYKPDGLYGYHFSAFPDLPITSEYDCVFRPTVTKELCLPFLCCELKREAAGKTLEVENQIKERLMHICHIYYKLEEAAGIATKVSTLPALGFSSIGPKFTFWAMVRYEEEDGAIKYDLRRIRKGSITNDEDFSFFVRAIQNIQYHAKHKRKRFIDDCVTRTNSSQQLSQLYPESVFSSQVDTELNISQDLESQMA